MTGIEGSVAIVTGAGQGIGRAIALRLASDGADVAVLDINLEKAQSVADDILALDRKSTAIKVDVSKRDQVQEAFLEARATLGRLDIVVNNAGIVQVEPIANVTPEALSTIFGVNVAGVVWGIQAAAKIMIDDGTLTQGAATSL